MWASVGTFGVHCRAPEKARAFLQDAQLCSDYERYDSAASRAYYAMFRMQLSHKEDLLVERVIEKIKEIDPAARVEVSLDTLGTEDFFILFYTEKSTLDIVRHTAPYTVDIAAHEGLEIVVWPVDRESSQ